MYEQHSKEIKISTHIIGSKQIDFILCSPTITSYITQSGITSFIEVSVSDYRGNFLDINLTKFFRNNLIDKTHISSRKIKISIPSNIKEYKHTYKTLHESKKKSWKIVRLKKQIKEFTLTIKDMKHIQYIDKHITEIVLSAKKKLSNKEYTHQ